MRVLVVNAGSSSLKLRLLDEDNTLLCAEDAASEHGLFDLETARAAILKMSHQADAVGHRVVHGGTRFTESVFIDAAVDRELRALIALAPLHQPKSLAGIDLVHELLPDLPAVACFDTAFHAHMPAEATTYAVPADWRRRLGVRRFGFHGLSHQYASRRAADLIGRPEEALRIVTCHLGAGASLAAVVNARSVETTMGFTPLEGLVMATRSGSVDPGLVLWLLQQPGFDVDQVSNALESESGLLALAGTSDMAEVEENAHGGDPNARLALSVYAHRVRAAIAAMAAGMGGIDALAFTGGVGENAASLRALAASGLEFLGIRLDEDRNSSANPDTEVSAGDSIPVLVLRAREDLQIAAEVRSVLS
jgi:acetate kinase